MDFGPHTIKRLMIVVYVNNNVEKFKVTGGSLPEIEYVRGDVSPAPVCYSDLYQPGSRDQTSSSAQPSTTTKTLSILRIKYIFCPYYKACKGTTYFFIY